MSMWALLMHRGSSAVYELNGLTECHQGQTTLDIRDHDFLSQR